MKNSQQVHNENELLELLQSGPCNGAGWLLGIDGEQRAGKSTLARSLAESLSVSVLECDCFVKRGRLAYPDALDLVGLKKRLTDARESRESLIVESVMLQLILRAISIVPTSIVYVRHSWPIGSLTHPNHFDPESIEKQLQTENEFCRNFGIADDKPILAREILHYHREFLPHITADVLFEHSFAIDS